MTWMVLDTWIVIIAVLCAASCALLGSFLVLRGLSMMGDAISHAVLPGLAGGFFLVLFLRSNETVASWMPWLASFMQGVDPLHPAIMFTGAAVVGLLTALFTEWISGFAQVERGAAMGVVFTTLFAIGLIMIDHASDHRVDLDASCVLLGQLEIAAGTTWPIMGLEIPRAAIVLAAALGLNALFVVVFYKELKLSSFDPALATTLGINARLMHYLLMALVAITTVASFEAVGSILVIAMLIVPAATAFLLVERLSLMLIMAVLIGAASGGLGHLAAITVPTWFGFQDTNTSGAMAVCAGALFTLAMFAGPRHGLIRWWILRAQLARRILEEDVLGFLYRLEELGLRESPQQFVGRVAAAIHARPTVISRMCRGLARRGAVDLNEHSIDLTEAGRHRARDVVRSHRLWESYLVKHLGLRPDHVHDTAMVLEHVTGAAMRERLAQRLSEASTDPHGRQIPAEISPAESTSE